MFGPARLYFALRDHADLGLLAAVAASTVLFTGTPFVLEDVAREFGVSVGAAGLISTAQVGAFAVTTFVAGRRLRTARVYLVLGSVAAVSANVASAFAGTFGILLATRLAAGMGAGMLVWLAWARGMRTAHGLRTMSAVGPVTALVAAPVLAWVAGIAGADGVFLVVAAASAPSAVLRATFSGFRPDRTRISPSRSNVVLLISLGIMTLSANGLWVYTAVLGEREVGLSPLVVSLAYSGNALAGFLAARVVTKPLGIGAWMVGIGVAAGLVAFGSNPLLFFAGVLLWGFSFWMAVPMVFTSIADWSLAPEERVGDAQSAMAAGRAIGPAIGGALVGPGTSFVAIGLYAVGGVALAAGLAHGVAVYRRSNEPPAGAVETKRP